MDDSSLFQLRFPARHTIIRLNFSGFGFVDERPEFLEEQKNFYIQSVASL